MKTKETAIAVPGKWNSRKELLDSIASNCPGFVMAGNLMKEIRGGGSVQVVIDGPNTAAPSAMRIGGGGRFSESYIDQVASHTMTAYFIAKVKNKDHYHSLVRAAAAAVRSGGLAVILETSGLAFADDEWLELAKEPDDERVYDWSVARLVEAQSFSRGMRAYGLPDVLVPTSLTIEESFDLMDEFNKQQLKGRPEFKALEWFSFSGQERAFRIVKEPDTRTHEGHPFYNPYGLIRLIAAEEGPAGKMFGSERRGRRGKR